MAELLQAPHGELAALRYVVFKRPEKHLGKHPPERTEPVAGEEPKAEEPRSTTTNLYSTSFPPSDPACAIEHLTFKFTLKINGKEQK